MQKPSETKKKAHISLELGHKVLDEGIVKILPAKKCVSVGRLDLKHPLLNLQHRDIECPSTQVIHRYAAETRQRARRKRVKLQICIEVCYTTFSNPASVCYCLGKTREFYQLDYLCSSRGNLTKKFILVDKRKEGELTDILSSVLSSPYARAAAVGSLITRSTLRPAICPASFVACRSRVDKRDRE